MSPPQIVTLRPGPSSTGKPAVSEDRPKGSALKLSQLRARKRELEQRRLSLLNDESCDDVSSTDTSTSRGDSDDDASEEEKEKENDLWRGQCDASKGKVGIRSKVQAASRNITLDAMMISNSRHPPKRKIPITDSSSRRAETLDEGAVSQATREKGAQSQTQTPVKNHANPKATKMIAATKKRVALLDCSSTDPSSSSDEGSEDEVVDKEDIRSALSKKLASLSMASPHRSTIPPLPYPSLTVRGAPSNGSGQRTSSSAMNIVHRPRRLSTRLAAVHSNTPQKASKQLFAEVEEVQQLQHIVTIESDKCDQALSSIAIADGTSALVQVEVDIEAGSQTRDLGVDMLSQTSTGEQADGSGAVAKEKSKGKGSSGGVKRGKDEGVETLEEGKTNAIQSDAALSSEDCIAKQRKRRSTVTKAKVQPTSSYEGEDDSESDSDSDDDSDAYEEEDEEEEEEEEEDSEDDDESSIEEFRPRNRREKASLQDQNKTQKRGETAGRSVESIRKKKNPVQTEEEEEGEKEEKEKSKEEEDESSGDEFRPRKRLKKVSLRDGNKKQKGRQTFETAGEKEKSKEEEDESSGDEFRPRKKLKKVSLRDGNKKQKGRQTFETAGEKEMSKEEEDESSGDEFRPRKKHKKLTSRDQNKKQKRRQTGETAGCSPETVRLNKNAWLADWRRRRKITSSKKKYVRRKKLILKNIPKVPPLPCLEGLSAEQIEALRLERYNQLRVVRGLPPRSAKPIPKKTVLKTGYVAYIANVQPKVGRSEMKAKRLAAGLPVRSDKRLLQIFKERLAQREKADEKYRVRAEIYFAERDERNAAREAGAIDTRTKSQVRAEEVKTKQLQAAVDRAEERAKIAARRVAELAVITAKFEQEYVPEEVTDKEYRTLQRFYTTPLTKEVIQEKKKVRAVQEVVNAYMMEEMKVEMRSMAIKNIFDASSDEDDQNPTSTLTATSGRSCPITVRSFQ